jgi:hypothetical protein
MYLSVYLLSTTTLYQQQQQQQQYQEEVINNLWQSFTSLKKTSEHKDETINQLYYRLSTHQGDGKDPTSSTAGVGLSDKPHDIEFFPQARVIPVRTPGQETATVMVCYVLENDENDVD